MIVNKTSLARALSLSHSLTLSRPSTERRHTLEWDDLGPPVVPGGQEIDLGSRNLRPSAEARPMGGGVTKERLGDWDGQTHV